MTVTETPIRTERVYDDGDYGEEGFRTYRVQGFGAWERKVLRLRGPWRF